MIDNLTFEDPWWFLLIPLIAVGWWWLRRRDWLQRRELSMGHVGSFLQLTTWRILLHRIGQVALALAVLSALVGMARPQLQFVERNEEAEGIDIMLVMDVSSSMLTRDLVPNRLEASKAVAQEFVGERRFDKIGLVAFGSESYTVSPLTLDHTSLQRQLGEIDLNQFYRATAIGMGLTSAINGLRDDDAPSKIVILLSDGVSNAGSFDPVTASNLAAEFGIKVYTIGVGTNGIAEVPEISPNGNLRYRRRRVRLDDSSLRQIAQLTGGQYYRAQDNEGLAAVYAEIDRLEKTPVNVSISRRFEDLYAYFIGTALALLLLAGIIRIWLVPRLL